VKTIFVTGTDTAVGKTVVSRALLQCFAKANLCAAGYKPVAKSAQHTPEGLRNKDAVLLQQASGLTLSYSDVNPVTLEEDEISTSPAQRIDYPLLNRGLAGLQDRAARVVVEGTGGWRSLMNDLRPLSQWVQQAQLPVVLVVGIKEGCISHALLTAEAIAADGLTLAGWVANRINPGLAHYAEIIDVLRDKLNAPLLGELPYLPRAEQRDLSGYLDITLLGGDALHSESAKPAA
jgi:dethiobiotin synthase (EC 6.3.3.3)